MNSREKLPAFHWLRSAKCLPSSWDRCAVAWLNPSKCLEVPRPLATDPKSPILNHFSAAMRTPGLDSVCGFARRRWHWLADQQGKSREGKTSRHVVNHIHLTQVQPWLQSLQRQVHLENHRFAVLGPDFV